MWLKGERIQNMNTQNGSACLSKLDRTDGNYAEHCTTHRFKICKIAVFLLSNVQITSIVVA